MQFCCTLCLFWCGAECLCDGRVQPPKSIIAQVQMQNRVPIHTISFNCNDHEANQFLYDLAQATEGRYHYFSEGGVPVEQPDSWQVSGPGGWWGGGGGGGRGTKFCPLTA